MNETVTLKEILDARDGRRRMQGELLALYGCPVISLTVMSAGNVKRTVYSLFVAEQAVAAIKEKFGKSVVYSVERDLITGYEAMLCVTGDGADIKKRTCEIELRHSLGRFMDVDVIDLDGRPISREAVGFEGRKCLICGKPVHDCMRNGTHTAEEINAVVAAAVERIKAD